MNTLAQLPVDDIFVQLNEALKSSPNIVLQAPPGAGKSTRLPILLLEQGANQGGRFSSTNQIIILEPRRVAARQIASYLAQQLGESVGQTIGLAMRGEQLRSSQTILMVVTDGVLVRMLQQDPELSGRGMLIFDECHGRALQADLALALSIDAQQLNEQLSILIMSATLDANELSEQLDAEVVVSAGRQFPVTINHVPSELKPSIADIVRAIKIALVEHDSSVLVFLSGIAEINKVHDALQQTLKDLRDHNTDLFLLYGGLTIENQMKAIRPSVAGRRKVVLSTNIAQTSLTIDGVDVVVDPGYEKSIQYMPRLNTEVLLTQPISKASAEQRAGRAGRLRPGFCYRLGAPEKLERRRQFDQPEIARSDLAELLLEVQAWGANIDQLFWATTPPTALVSAATTKLQTLGFWHAQSTEPTELAAKVKDIGADLRIVRLLHFAKLKLSDDSEKSAVALLAACLSESSLRLPTHFLDLLAHQHQYPQLRSSGIQQRQRRYLKLLDVSSQSISSPSKLISNNIHLSHQQSINLAVVVALAFPDRIAKQQKKRWKMSNAVEFHSSTSTTRSELIAVVDFNASEFGHYIQSYVEFDIADVKQIAPELITQQTRVRWSDSKQAPAGEAQSCIGDLVLTRQPQSIKLNAEEWQKVWLDYISKHGLKAFAQYENKILDWIARVELVDSFGLFNSPDGQEAKTFLAKVSYFTGATEADNSANEVRLESALVKNVGQWLAPYFSEIKSIKALKALNVVQVLNDELGWSASQRLKQWCPPKFTTPAGTSVNIDYLGAAPKISVRLQEMFGEPASPTICEGRQALQIELLSPALRPLQVTQDLANFWQNAYQEVKKEMRGRYPKHAWPDHPESEKAGHSLKSRR